MYLLVYMLVLCLWACFLLWTMSELILKSSKYFSYAYWCPLSLFSIAYIFALSADTKITLSDALHCVHTDCVSACARVCVSVRVCVCACVCSCVLCFGALVLWGALVLASASCVCVLFSRFLITQNTTFLSLVCLCACVLVRLLACNLVKITKHIHTCKEHLHAQRNTKTDLHTSTQQAHTSMGKLVHTKYVQVDNKKSKGCCG